MGIPEIQTKGIHPSAKLKIKVEVDTDPTMGFTTNSEFLQFPLPISILTLCKEDLFASKLHAAFFRRWKNRVKGRDWYDFVWFIQNNIPLDLNLFSNFLGESSPISGSDFLNLANEKIASLNIEGAL